MSLLMGMLLVAALLLAVLLLAVLLLAVLLLAALLLADWVLLVLWGRLFNLRPIGNRPLDYSENFRPRSHCL